MRTILVSLLLVAAPAFAQDKAAAPPAGEAAPAKGKKLKRSQLMDLNTASEDELKTLPGISDEIAKKIIAGRPYKGKDQLLKQNIVDKDEYAKIRPLVIAKQPKAAPAAGEAAPPSGTTAAPKK
jgi:DNA uptake protein ComE-like DNA-binding protein